MFGAIVEVGESGLAFRTPHSTMKESFSLAAIDSQMLWSVIF